MPSAAPVTFADGATVQANVVPATFLGVGKILIKAVPPLQIVTSDALAEGKGFTATTKSTGKPSQPLNDGVILYVTMPSTLPVLIGVSVIEPVPELVTEAGVIGPVTVLVHEKVVLPIFAVGTKFKA